MTEGPIEALREHLEGGRLELNDASIAALLACCAASLDDLGTPEPYRGQLLSGIEDGLRFQAALAKLDN